MLKPAVMLVSTSPEQLGEMAEALKGSDLEIFFARSGEEALAKIISQPVNLLVCDFKLSGINGVRLAQRVKKLFYGVKCLILISKEELRPYLLEVKNQTYFLPIIYKPLEAEIFVRRVIKLIKETPPRGEIILRLDVTKKFAKQKR